MREAIERARGRLEGRVLRTSCRRSEALSEVTGGDVWLKLENQQRSGSFKLRGVLNRILSLPAERSGRPLVAASTGNHGAAFVHALRELGREGQLFLPRSVSRKKLEAIQELGGDYELVGDDCVETERHAAEHARRTGGVFVSPYNDPEVVAGQGTVAWELLEQLDGIDAVLVPVGGGGLISGIGAYLEARAAEVELIACQPAASPVMYESVRAGSIVERASEPTLSDATAGGIEPGSITFELCRRHVDRFVLLSESEIAAAIRFAHREESLVLEGGAALPVAALLGYPEDFEGRRVAAVLTGSKIDDDVLRRILR